jgi:serine/threonine protein kinase
MDKYHIYEEIGKGEFSIVYKGREKKKIEYVAIKRIEKSMMSKVICCDKRNYRVFTIVIVKLVL